MRLLLQRVRKAQVRDAGNGGTLLGSIDRGLLALAGFGPRDGPGPEDLPSTPVWEKMLSKTLDLRIFPDQGGKLNLSLADFGGQLLVVSQFTLYADCRRGRRPSFSGAAHPSVAEPLYNRLCADLAARLPGRVQTGSFGADMDVELVNWGPVTIWLDSEELA